MYLAQPYGPNIDYSPKVISFPLHAYLPFLLLQSLLSLINLIVISWWWLWLLSTGKKKSKVKPLHHSIQKHKLFTNSEIPLYNFILAIKIKSGKRYSAECNLTGHNYGFHSNLEKENCK